MFDYTSWFSSFGLGSNNTSSVSSDRPTHNAPSSEQPINQLSTVNTSISPRTLSDHLATLVFGMPNRVDPEIKKAFNGIAADIEKEQNAPIVHMEATEPQSLHKKIPSPETLSTGRPKSDWAHLPSSGESLNRLDSASSLTSNDSDKSSSFLLKGSESNRFNESQFQQPLHDPDVIPSKVTYENKDFEPSSMFWESSMDSDSNRHDFGSSSLSLTEKFEDDGHIDRPKEKQVFIPDEYSEQSVDNDTSFESFSAHWDPSIESDPDTYTESSTSLTEQSESEAELPQSVSDNADAPVIRTYLKGVRSALEKVANKNSSASADDSEMYIVLNAFLNNYRTGGLGRKIGNVIAMKVFRGNETFTHHRDRAADFTDKANGSEYAEKFVNYVNTHFNGKDQFKRDFFEVINNHVPQIKTAYERIQTPDKAPERKDSPNEDNKPKHYIREKDSEQLDELFGTLAQLQSKDNTSARDEYRQVKESAVRLVNRIGLNAETRYGQTPLALALEQGATEVAKELIDQGADINKAKGLHIAAKKGDADLFDFLKTRLAQEDKLNLEDTDRSGWTPLRVAVSYGKKNIVKQLIQDGADVFKATSEDRAFNSDNPNDETKIRPLIYDAIHLEDKEIPEDKEIFDLLMEKYKSENRIDEPAMYGYTPLLEAVAKKQIDLAESLVKNGANVDANLRQRHNLFSLAHDKKIPLNALKQILGDKYNNTSDTIPGTYNLEQINAKVREGKLASKNYWNSFDNRF